MSDNTTNRERLLRLIDGGPDALKELHQERLSKMAELASLAPEPAAAEKKETSVKSSPLPASPAVEVKPEVAQNAVPAAESSTPSSRKEEDQNWAKLLAPLFLLLMILFGLRYASEWIRPSQKIAPSPEVSILSDEKPAPLANAPSVDNGVQDETGLRLVGVDYSDPPVALLEDLKTGKTYFAKTNDRVKNVKIQQILKNKIVVSLNGKTMELQ